MDNIIWFRSDGEYRYRFLSNFFPVTIEHDGLVWPSAEHLYQAMKTPHLSDQELIRMEPTAFGAMRKGRQVLVRPDWDPVSTMRIVLRLKFQLSSLRRSLLDTGDVELMEENQGPWGGLYGGDNRLGKMLMELREELS